MKVVLSSTSMARQYIAVVYEHTKRTQEILFADWVQSYKAFFWAQTGASIRLTVWKWSSESRYPEALPPVLENFRRSFSPDLTDCPWVSEDI